MLCSPPHIETASEKQHWHEAAWLVRNESNGISELERQKITRLRRYGIPVMLGNSFTLSPTDCPTD
jgi:hypothetical protein